ncbi:efflux RND transporter periplasmic adaptor subunit [Loktanella sp. M215]|uniref:efflux RND transporter periplasmic adaptor subunit n=1 Tax=Loktanella sp. M215 TaxID=2675431 RepID=UPI001F010C94|nr:efflux RND transporter periplasmic adaptor subunit [Loktanella sp. M215]MCF7698006.1 efflux RND transporter periplasmic adaptor subunit [Loktanella sp. M215]
MFKKRITLLIVIALIALAVAVYFLRPTQSPTVAHTGTTPATAEPATTAAALTVTVSPPETADWPVEVTASGWLAAWQDVVISAQVGGQMIQTVEAAVGDTVAEGAVIATLSRTSLDNDILQLEASLESAQAALDQATAEADRARKLSGGSAISEQQAAQYVATERKAKADVASAEAQLASANLDLSHTQVTAVTGGIVASRSAAIGDVVAEGQELFRLVRDGRVEWQAEVPLGQLRQVEVGTPVIVPTPLGNITGTVRRIAPAASESNGRVIVYVALTPPDGDTQPKTGIMISGVFQTGLRPALSVPASAVVMQDGFSYVFALNDDGATVTRIKVDTDRRQRDRVEITSALSADAQIVHSGGAFLSDGSVVRVVTQDAASADAADTQTALKTANDQTGADR